MFSMAMHIKSTVLLPQDSCVFVLICKLSQVLSGHFTDEEILRNLRLKGYSSCDISSVIPGLENNLFQFVSDVFSPSSVSLRFQNLSKRNLFLSGNSH